MRGIIGDAWMGSLGEHRNMRGEGRGNWRVESERQLKKRKGRPDYNRITRPR